jgi:lipoate-protein ligase A
MLIISNQNINTAFNLAAEEYMLKNFKEEIFMLWQGKSSILIGKNQNSLAEVNIDYVNKHNIPVVRRITGGGTVFCDLGNINFTFITNDDKSFVDFRRFTKPIIEVLRSLGVEAEFSGRNDLIIKGKKFSGNAQYKYKSRLLHHGTLLFSSDVRNLSMALNPKQIKYESKGIKSVKSRITNISAHIQKKIDIMEFKKLIYKHIESTDYKSRYYDFTEKDIKEINRLVNEKYNTWEWNFGNSPKYSFVNQKKFSGGIVEINFEVKKGKITAIKIYGDFFGKLDIKDIENALIDIEHEPNKIRDVLENFNFNDYFYGITVDQFIEVLF